MTDENATRPTRNPLTASRAPKRPRNPQGRIDDALAARITRAAATHHRAAYDPGEPFPFAHYAELRRVAERSSHLSSITQAEHRTITHIIDNITTPF